MRFVDWLNHLGGLDALPFYLGALAINTGMDRFANCVGKNGSYQRTVNSGWRISLLSIKIGGSGYKILNNHNGIIVPIDGGLSLEAILT
ncbi:hypothetical protein DMA11_23275 [Marinilabiliaceae bacterium JC017]|nr:hypothetical protein DMA11_23275 [Marinilabiliaceae bacterium JC017]